MKALSLCSGIGGIDLACEWAGIETVAFCEIEKFCQKVLRKHWPGVPIYDDLKKLTKDRMDEDGIDTGAIRVIHSGYPCQPFSLAGKREGEKDDRHLWPEVARLLESIRPTWFVGENVNGHVTMGLDTVLTDLGTLNYTAQSFLIPAKAVDGDHERYRVFIVAHANSKPRLQADKTTSAVREIWRTWKNASGSGWRPIPRVDWGISGPPVSRESNGVSRELDESRAVALGNAVVPQQIYPIIAAIKQIDDLLRSEENGGNKGNQG